ncbi:MAG: hypothetical protein ACT4PZ_14755 [Panacagrimonas sp.]
MLPADFAESGYVMIRAFLLEEYTKGGEKKYHLSALIVERSSRKIVANSDLWISNSDLDYKPTALYEDSQMYPRDERLQGHLYVARGAVGTLADQAYYDALETSALLVEAEGLFETRKYDESAKLFEQAAARPDGQVMKT